MRLATCNRKTIVCLLCGNVEGRFVRSGGDFGEAQEALLAHLWDEHKRLRALVTYSENSVAEVGGWPRADWVGPQPASWKRGWKKISPGGGNFT